MASSSDSYGYRHDVPDWLHHGQDKRSAARYNKMLEDMDIAFRIQSKNQSELRKKWYSPYAVGADVGFDTDGQFLNPDGTPMTQEQMDAESGDVDIW